MKKFIFGLSCISLNIFAHEEVRENAVLYMDGDGSNYIEVYGHVYYIPVMYHLLDCPCYEKMKQEE